MLTDQRRAFWLAYKNERSGSFEFRCRRYAAVRNLMDTLAPNDLVVDVGAGACEFGRYLYAVRGFQGMYQAIDGCIDGTDLETWSPPVTAEWFVAIEVAEHLLNPLPFLKRITDKARKGVVITTPNPDVVDVLKMDRTHKNDIFAEELEAIGFHVTRHCLFNTPNDTLVAYHPGDAK